MALDATHVARIAAMVQDCEKYRDDLSVDRERNLEYYNGEMRDTPADKGRSKVVSRDVRAVIKDVLPSVLRTILGNDQIVEYLPVGEGDEEACEQATEFVNSVVIPEACVEEAIHDAAHDALLLRNGVLKWWWDERTEIRVSKHTGLTDDALAQLVAGDDVEVIGHDASEGMVESPEGLMPVVLHDVKIKRRIKQRQAMACAVPLEQFLIHPEATSIETSPIVGQVMRLRRTDLVAMGYDPKIVAELPLSEEDDTEEDSRRPDVTDVDGAEPDPSLQEVDYYELYVRGDADGDGIAELRRVCFGGKVTSRGLLMEEECDDVQFCIVVAERKPHQWEGFSLADDTMDIQRIKTVLMRATLDNLYWQNNPQPIVDPSRILNPESVFEPQFGLPIQVKPGTDVATAYGFQPVPFVAKESFAMLDYLDKEKQQRTGVSDASAGLAPDALQNMTAKASAMIEAAGIGQTEMIVNTIAKSLRPFFKGLLRLIIRHQDMPRTVRLRNEWKQYDPRDWNAEMDAKVNTGLGAGTRERDMMMMQMVLGLQEKLLAGFGPDNPFVKPENVWNATSKAVEAAGLRTPSLYFTEPNPEEVQAKLEAMRNAPNPEQMKIQAQMQLEQAKMAANRDKEEAQMQADLVVKQKDLEATAALEERKLAFEREKLAAEMQMRMIELQAKQSVEQERLRQPVEQAAKAKSDEDQRTQAIMAPMQQIMAMIAEMKDAGSRPKRIIRDEMGEIAGVDMGDGRVMRAVRDANGDIETIEP
jgi:hypothetical protein